MVGIFDAIQRGADGLANRVNTASQSPAFGLGVGLLAGSPQQGFQNAAALNESRAFQEAQQRALQAKQAAAQQAAAQQAEENRRAEERLSLERQKFERGAQPSSVREAIFAAGGDEEAARALLKKKGQGSSQTPAAIQEALFVTGGDPAKAAEFLRNRRLNEDAGISFTTPDGSVIQIGGSGGSEAVPTGPGGQGAPSIRPTNTQEPFDFDVIEKATGPKDAALRILERTPVFGPILGEVAPGAGTDQRRARLVMEDINNDLRRAFAVNSSRISNFDLKLAEKLLPAASGVFSSEQAAVSDMVQLRDLIEKDLAQNIEAIQTPFLSPKARSEIQEGINSLSSASAKIGAVLDARAIALEAKGRGGNRPAPEAQLPEGISEEDVEFTMQKHGLSRDEVLRRIGGQ